MNTVGSHFIFPIKMQNSNQSFYHFSIIYIVIASCFYNFLLNEDNHFRINRNFFFYGLSFSIHITYSIIYHEQWYISKIKSHTNVFVSLCLTYNTGLTFVSLYKSSYFVFCGQWDLEKKILCYLLNRLHICLNDMHLKEKNKSNNTKQKHLRCLFMNKDYPWLVSMTDLSHILPIKMIIFSIWLSYHRYIQAKSVLNLTGLCFILSELNQNNSNVLSRIILYITYSKVG